MREYTRENLDWLKKEIARAAIRVHIEQDAVKRSMHCSGDAKVGFTLTDANPPQPGGSTYMEKYPSVDDGPTGPIPYLYKDGELQPTPTEDIWSKLYQPWFQAVEEVLDGWDSLPEPDPIRSQASRLESDGKALYVHVPGSEDADGLPRDPNLTDDLSTTIETITSITANFYGKTATKFHDDYVAHITTIAAGQHQLTAALAAALQAEGDILEEVRRTVMQLAEQAVTAMRGVGPHAAPDRTDENVLLSVIGIVAGAAANLFTKFNIAGTLISGAVSLFGEIFPSIPQGNRPELPLAGETPQEVLDHLRHALTRLNSAMLDEELAINSAAGDAVDLSYGAVGDLYFNLPAPGAVTETNANLLAGNPQLMRRVGDELMPRVAAKFATVHGAVSGLSLEDTSPWMRPGFIGFTDVGPHHAVASLAERLAFLCNDTAGELHAAGKTFSLAADVLEHTDDGAQAELDKHARSVADVAEPDPTRPRETPVGGYQP